VSLYYNVLGIMSGTSLDGVDMAYCIFEKSQGKWKFDIVESTTVEYGSSWQVKLRGAPLISGEALTNLGMEYGHYLGELCASFIEEQHLKPAIISSHGHTVFHNPTQGYTLQIGEGAAIYAHTKIPVIYDFRTQDLAFGGQGAPLVPIGDKLLFSNYSACVNLGGVANISRTIDSELKAWDIGFCNMVLNALSMEKGYAYDNNGALAASGKIDRQLMVELEQMAYYSHPYPKSLGREDYEKTIKPLMTKSKIATEDKMRTWVEHISAHIVSDIGKAKENVLFTGGGAHNDFLMQCIKDKLKMELIIPPSEIIDFKEALIFAFMGVLRMENENNILASVTGAVCDHCSGKIIGATLF